MTEHKRGILHTIVYWSLILLIYDLGRRDVRLTLQALILAATACFALIVTIAIYRVAHGGN